VFRQQILLKLLKGALHLIGGKSLGVVYSEITNLVYMAESVCYTDVCKIIIALISQNEFSILALLLTSRYSFVPWQSRFVTQQLKNGLRFFFVRTSAFLLFILINTHCILQKKILRLINTIVWRVKVWFCVLLLVCYITRKNVGCFNFKRLFQDAFSHFRDTAT